MPPRHRQLQALIQGQPSSNTHKPQLHPSYNKRHAHKRSVQTQAVCLPEYGWTYNSEGQSPCLIASYLISSCTGGIGNVGPLPANGGGYAVLDTESANRCTCSWAVYGVIQACAYCQTGNMTIVVAWSDYSAACSNDMLSAPDPYPRGFLIAAAIPGSYATDDPTTLKDGKFDPVEAEYRFFNGPNLEMTQFQVDIQDTESGDQSYSASRIVTLVVSLVLGCIFLGGVFWLTAYCPCSVGRRRRREWYRDKDDNEVNEGAEGNEEVELEEQGGEHDEGDEVEVKEKKPWREKIKSATTWFAMKWQGRGGYYAAVERRKEAEAEMKRLRERLLDNEQPRGEPLSQEVDDDRHEYESDDRARISSRRSTSFGETKADPPVEVPDHYANVDKSTREEAREATGRSEMGTTGTTSINTSSEYRESGESTGWDSRMPLDVQISRLEGRSQSELDAYAIPNTTSLEDREQRPRYATPMRSASEPNPDPFADGEGRYDVGAPLQHAKSL